MKSRNIFYSSFSLISCLLLTINSFAQFCYAKNIISDTVSYSIVNADFNQDGFEDLASVDMGMHVSVFLGDGHGFFANPVKYDIGAMAMGMSVISQDFNNDGKLDLVIADMMNMKVVLLLGNGNGAFGSPTSFPVAPTPYMLMSADFNNDGKFDIATANSSSNNISVLLGNGNGVFTDTVNFPIGVNTYPTSIAGADFNKDGDPDLVVGNSNTNSVSVLLGHGDGTFDNASALTVGVSLNAFPQSVISLDLNEDGNMDVASANGGDNTVTVLLGNGNGTFGSGNSYAVTPSGNQTNFPQSITAADFNGDGKIDLATANNASEDISILLNDGAGGFKAVAAYTAGAYPYVLISADFNNDAAIDIVVANSSSKEISLLLNCPAGRIDTIYADIAEFNPLNEIINIYPNPNNGKFQFATSKLELTSDELTIWNTQGEKTSYSIVKKFDSFIIDISDKPNGIYFLQLNSKKTTVVKKLVIQK